MRAGACWPSRDAIGVWTSGIDCTARNARPITAGLTITEGQCDALFAVTLAVYLTAVHKGLKVEVGSHVFVPGIPKPSIVVAATPNWFARLGGSIDDR